MATNVFDLMATLGLDSSKYDSGLDKAKAAGSMLGSGLATAAKVGLTAVTAATGATVAFAKSSIDAGMSFDQAMSGVAATMGKTMDEMKTEVGSVDTQYGHFEGTLRDFAQFMGQNTAFSATQAAEALNYMALAGYKTQESMNMLPNVLNMAAAGGMELARASDMITDTQSALGIDLERTSLMVDEFAKAASTGNTSVEQLGDAFLTVGGLAKELNGGMVTLADGTQKPVDGIQELEIALTAMANAGIKGGEAGTHMRNMLLKLSSPTSDGTKALEAMGVSVFDTEGKMRSLSDVFEDLSTKLGKMTDEQRIQTIADLFNTRDLASAEALLSAVGQDWDEIGESILDAEGAAAQMANTKLDNLAGSVTLFKSALEGAQIAISDQLSPELKKFVDFGTEGLSTLTQAFQSGGLSGAMEAFGKILTDGLNMIIEMLPEFVNAGMELLGALGRGLLQNLPTIIDAAVQIINQLVQGLVTALPALAEGALQIILGLADGLTQMLPTLIPEAVEMIITIVNGILDNADKMVDAAVALIEGLTIGLINALPTLIEKAPEIITKLIAALCNAAPKMLEAATTIIAQLVVGLVDNAPQLLEGAVAMIESLLLGIVSLYQSVMDAGAGLVKKILEGLESIGFDAFQWGLDLILGMVDGIKNGFSALGDAVGGAAGIIKSILHFSVPDEGPLADADQYMPDMMKLFADGIAANGQQVIAALVTVLTNLQTNIITFCTNAILNITTTLTNIATTVADYCLQFIDTANRTLSDILNKVITWMSQIPPKMVYYITSAVNGFMNILNQLPGKVASVLQNIINKVIEFGTNLVNKAIQIAKNFADALINGIRDLPSRFAEVGSNIVQGLWNGISSGWSWLQDQVSELANGLLEAAKDALDIESPSKKFYWIGQMVDEGFANGIGDNAFKVDRAMEEMLDATESVPGATSNTGTSAGTNGGGFTQYVSITSPVALTPYEVARQTRNATRDLVLAMSGV